MDRLGRKDSIAALHRDNIISAADELFNKKGFEKTTMDEISERAQYSKRTIYAYFESKEEIYSYFVVKGARLLLEEFEKAISYSDNFIECYHEICNVISSFHKNQLPYYEGVMSFFNGTKQDNPSEIIAEIYSVNNKINKTFERFFKEGQNAGIILQNVDIKKLVFIVWSNLISFIELTSKKNDYINTTLHSTTEEFTSFGFNLILNAVLDVG